MRHWQRRWRAQRRRRRFVAILARALLAIATAAGTGQPAPADTFRLVTGDGYPPFSGRDLKNGGMAAWLVRAALQTQGHSVKIAVRPWPRAYAKTRSGRFDGAFPYVRTAERIRHVRYSSPLYTIQDRIVSAADSPIRWGGDRRRLVGKRTCVPTGYALGDTIAPLVKAGRITRITPRTAEACARLLLKGRADFAVWGDMNFRRMLAREGMPLDAFHIAETPAGTSDLHVIAPREAPRTGRLIRAVNTGLRALKASGRYQEIVGAFAPDRRAAATMRGRPPNGG